MNPLTIIICIVIFVAFGLFLTGWRPGGKTEEDSPLEWDLAEMPKPWDTNRVAICSFLMSEINGSRKELQLPDDSVVFADGKIRWAGGAMDGVFTQHMQDPKDKDSVQKIFKDLESLILQPTQQKVAAFYKLLLKGNVLSFIDDLLTLIAESENLNVDRVHDFARWIATESPDREPIKVALAILGIFEGEQHKKLFMTFARHDEFTLYAGTALMTSLDDPESTIWECAKMVEGWGRIHLVENLTKTTNPEIKDWLLREGYKNSISYEYLVCACAVTGDLLTALKQDEPDVELLQGAGDIIENLIHGGAAKGIKDYADGVEVTRLYLKHIEAELPDLYQLKIIDVIRDFVESEESEDPDDNWSGLEKVGWAHKVREEIAAACHSILDRPGWKEEVLKALETEDDLEEHEFYTLTSVAQVLDVDVWEYHFKRQKSGKGNEWYYLMQTDDVARIENVIALAEETLPLEKVATGPAEELGLGPGFEAHQALEFIVQDLKRFPGKGWKLIEASLKSSVIRNRNMALKALSEWGPAAWPPEAKPALEQAHSLEPNADVKKSIQKVLDGEGMEK